MLLSGNCSRPLYIYVYFVNYVCRICIFSMLIYIHTYVCTYMPTYTMIECLKKIEKKPNTDVKLPASGGTVSQNDGNVAIPSDIESKILSNHHGMCMHTYLYMYIYYMHVYNIACKSTYTSAIRE